MKRVIICGILAAAGAVSASAQTMLVGADVTKKLPCNFSVEAGLEYRTQDWFKHSDQWSVEAAASYKPVKYFKVGVGYKFIQGYTPENEDLKNYRLIDDYWVNKHRVSVSATGQYTFFGKLTLSLRERYQYTYRPSKKVARYDMVEDYTPDGFKNVEAKSKHVLRSRIGAEFKAYKKCRFTPYVNWELYSQLKVVDHDRHRHEGARLCDKWRLTAGTDIRINKHNELSVFYRYCNAADAADGDEPHTIGLTYSLKF